jgi:hypothetical protein
MAYRIRAMSLECPEETASAAARKRYKSILAAANMSSSFLEGDLAMRVRKRVTVKKKAAAKRATSRKRR